MCGLAGYFSLASDAPAALRVVEDMLLRQHHRGPDDSGIHFFSLRNGSSKAYSNYEPITETYQGVLGFNRLSILDLSHNGHQPMMSEDGNVLLVFNGEIYNAFDFKPSLEADGFVFKSTSDTEVILKLYLKYGFDRMIRMLNGMFAVVLVDLRLGAVFMARDRFGIKPLYIYQTKQRIAFASELKSFLAFDDFVPELNVDALDEFMLFRNVINQTLFKNVEGLEPGSYRCFTRDGVKAVTFFDANDYRRSTNGPTDAKAFIADTLKASVSRQLISDVKLGCQLSGGIDSSLVTYLARQAQPENLLETISIVFRDPRFSEERFMNQVCQSMDILSHKFELQADYYLDHLAKATWHFESPLNHPNTIGIYLLSQHARQYVTVLLSGEGADEVFAGYSRFVQVLHPFAPRTVLSAVKKERKTLAYHIKSYTSPAYRAAMVSSFMTLSEAAELLEGFDAERALTGRRDLFNTLQGSALDKQVKYELKTYLPDLLIRQDKMSMAHSIENRVPFLDNEVVDASFMIPESQLVSSSGRQTKAVLKKIAAEVFGDAFAYRDKAGFSIPLREFFQQPQFAAYLHDEIVPAISSRGRMNGRLVSQWINNVENISSRELDALWVAIAFEVWASQFKLK